MAIYGQKELEFLESMRIVDIQQNYYESLTAGLFSLDEEVLPDPVLRISDNVDPLFDMGYLDLIAEHNETCLISTLTLLKKRFFKLNLIDLNYYKNQFMKIYKDTLIIYLTDNSEIQVKIC